MNNSPRYFVLFSLCLISSCEDSAANTGVIGMPAPVIGTPEPTRVHTIVRNHYGTVLRSSTFLDVLTVDNIFFGMKSDQFMVGLFR